MNRHDKEQVIEALRSDFAASQAAFLVGYKGMSVAQLTALRKKLRDKGGSFKVAKVTLIKRVIHDAPTIEGLMPYLKDQIGIVFVDNDAPAVAKVLQDFAKDNQQLQVVAGRLESAILGKESVDALASLPSKEVLLANVCGALNSPIVGLVGTLNMMLLKLVLTLKAIEEKKAST